MDEFKHIEYLGDGAYLGMDDIGRLWIFTSNGVDIDNKICLEYDTGVSLIIALRKFGYKDMINVNN